MDRDIKRPNRTVKYREWSRIKELLSKKNIPFGGSCPTFNKHRSTESALREALTTVIPSFTLNRLQINFLEITKPKSEREIEREAGRLVPVTS